MSKHKPHPPRVLIIYYSLSAQTNGLVHRLGEGLCRQGVEVVYERLRPLKPLKFPIGTVMATLAMMLITFFRGRIPIKPLSAAASNPTYDLLVLAGPTWSYNPSGPVLSLLDRDGASLFAGRQVLPLISCRGYWRFHWLGLRLRLRAYGAKLHPPLIYTHPSKEPWRTIGVFLKLCGRVPERSWLIGRYYPRYGHSKEQLEAISQIGEHLGQALQKQEDLTSRTHPL